MKWHKAHRTSTTRPRRRWKNGIRFDSVSIWIHEWIPILCLTETKMKNFVFVVVDWDEESEIIVDVWRCCCIADKDDESTKNLD